MKGGSVDVLKIIIVFIFSLKPLLISKNIKPVPMTKMRKRQTI